MAEQILPKFIPKDKTKTKLTFQFTLVPVTTYKVNFIKKELKGQVTWEFVDFEEVKNIV